MYLRLGESFAFCLFMLRNLTWGEKEKKWGQRGRKGAKGNKKERKEKFLCLCLMLVCLFMYTPRISVAYRVTLII